MSLMAKSMVGRWEAAAPTAPNKAGVGVWSRQTSSPSSPHSCPLAPTVHSLSWSCPMFYARSPPIPLVSRKHSPTDEETKIPRKNHHRLEVGPRYGLEKRAHMDISHCIEGSAPLAPHNHPHKAQEIGTWAELPLLAKGPKCTLDSGICQLRVKDWHR